MLSSTIIDDITRQCKSGPSLAIAFFYFDFQNENTRSPAVLRSLIKQFSLSCATIPDALVRLFSKNEEEQRSPTVRELTSTLWTIIGKFRNVYLVFDALDGSPDRHAFLAFLGQIHDWGIDDLHMLATRTARH